MVKLGVNIDHVATLRQARNGIEPDPVWAAAAAELGGADGITIHLREDRRHIQDRDLRILKETVSVKLNLELACEDNVCEIAFDVKPDQVCLVPEKREEITTEGGLDVAASVDRITELCKRFADSGIVVSLFIDPDEKQVRAAKAVGAPAIELHTGQYALACSGCGKAGNAGGEPGSRRISTELDRLRSASELTGELGMVLNAGHGLNYTNVQPVAEIPTMDELNIGHSIVSRSLFCGLESAVREMKRLITF